MLATDITEIPAKDGKLYVSAIFDCFDNVVLGLSMADNMEELLYGRFDSKTMTIANTNLSLKHRQKIFTKTHKPKLFA